MRTDVHRPSAVIPADYEFVVFENIKMQGFGDCAYVLEERRRLREHMERTGGTYAHFEHGGVCQVCGNANAVWTILFYHAKSNSYIRVGQDCARKLEMSSPDGAEFRRSVENALEARAGKAKAQAVLAEAGLSAAWDIYLAAGQWRIDEQKRFDVTGVSSPRNLGPQYEELTIEDIVGKLIRYGSVSEAQKGFIQKLLGKIDGRAAFAAQREAENAAAKPAVAGRQKLIGTVIGMKVVERPTYHYGDSGEQTKLLIQTEDGWKTYGNRFENLEKGEKVEFTATIEVSEKDPKFSFYKRPKLHRRLSTEVPA